MNPWLLDPMHSTIQFSVRHMMVSNVRGSFREFALEVEFDPEHPELGSVQATVEAASIDTGATAARRAPLLGGLPQRGAVPKAHLPKHQR